MLTSLSFHLVISILFLWVLTSLVFCLIINILLLWLLTLFAICLVISILLQWVLTSFAICLVISILLLCALYDFVSHVFLESCFLCWTLVSRSWQRPRAMFAHPWFAFFFFKLLSFFIYCIFKVLLLVCIFQLFYILCTVAVPSDLIFIVYWWMQMNFICFSPLNISNIPVTFFLQIFDFCCVML